MMIRRMTGVCVMLVLLAVAALAPFAGAQRTYAQDARCFPETGQCISGRFRQYWEQNGGLAVFGFPITSAQNEVNRDNNQTYLTQWFERNRFELHTENAAPYDVLLGRLGNDQLQQQGRDWHSFPTVGASNSAQCFFAPQTGHNVCGDFFQYFRTHGLEFDGQAGFSTAENIALFGLPLSEPQQEVGSDGNTYLTQWFERARFEYHPNETAPYKVLLGLLGTQVHGAQTQATPRFDVATDAVNMLTSFYNAIDRQEYSRAYGYWENPPQTLEQFTQGYADTRDVQLAVQPPTFYDGAAGSMYVNIPTALIATHQDGSQQTFVGCYMARRVNVDPNNRTWHINSANIGAVAANSNVAALLAQACSAPADAAQAFAGQDTPVNTLAAFYNAINRREYQRAYGYWEHPTQSYDQFVQGYADTQSVQLIVRAPTQYDAGAGNIYTKVPTVLVATHADGSQQTFAGCYTMHHVNIDPNNTSWGINQANIAPATADVMTSLAQGCGAE